jgi:hypothetical protein
MQGAGLLGMGFLRKRRLIKLALFCWTDPKWRCLNAFWYTALYTLRYVNKHVNNTIWPLKARRVIRQKGRWRPEGAKWAMKSADSLLIFVRMSQSATVAWRVSTRSPEISFGM